MARRRGKITVLTGPMFSGKTTELLRLIDVHERGRRNVLVIKPKRDDRYTATKVCSHSGGSHDAVVVDRLRDIELNDAVTHIFVDEGQFFSDLVEICDRWADDGRVVFIAALDMYDTRLPFGSQMACLLCLAENVQKLTAVCETCGEDASFTASRVQHAENCVDVGGAEKYMALCRACYIAHRPKTRHPNRVGTAAKKTGRKT